MVQTRSLSLRPRVGSTSNLNPRTPRPHARQREPRDTVHATQIESSLHKLYLQTVLHFTAIRQKHQPDTEAEADDSDSPDRAAGGGALLSALSFVR